MKKLILIAMSALFIFTLHSDAKETGDAKVYCKGKFTHLRKGSDVYYTDEESHQFFSVPEPFEGYRVTLRSVGSSDPLKFTVKKAGIVRLVVGGRSTKRLINEGWVKTHSVSIASSDGILQSAKICVLQKQLGVGKYSMPSAGNFGVRLLKK